jgi:hypothetical protein
MTPHAGGPITIHSTAAPPTQHSLFAIIGISLSAIGCFNIPDRRPRLERAVIEAEDIYGEQGVIDLTKLTAPTHSNAGAIKPSKLPREETPVPAVETPDHFLNWLQCLRTRQAANAPIEAGYCHCVPGLMAMRALDSGRRQIYDAAKREIREGRSRTWQGSREARCRASLPSVRQRT